MTIKGKSSRPVAAGTRAKTNYINQNYSRKKRLSKAQKEILHNAFGAILMFLAMVGIVILMLLVG